jgi:transposase
MNVKLQHVISDITGKSGQAIIKAIIDGDTNPDTLISHLDRRIKASHEEVKKSLKGIWKKEHLFELKQSYEMYHSYNDKIKECDKEIEMLLRQHPASGQPDKQMPGKAKPKSNKNNVSFDASSILYAITGQDLTAIYGINDSNALEILSEIGFDMGKWPTAKHFTSWLNLAPNNKISGAKVLSSKTQKKKNKAGLIFRLAAYAIQRSKNHLASFFQRIKAKHGAPKAITATARKLAVIFYKMLKDNVPFNPPSIEEYNQSIREKQIQGLTKKAHKLGLKLQILEVVS